MGKAKPAEIFDLRPLSECIAGTSLTLDKNFSVGRSRQKWHLEAQAFAFLLAITVGYIFTFIFWSD
jgi:hypothetical protein